jgi:hypothetical protein
MSIVPSGQKFHTVPSNVQTVERGSALANSQREIYTMQDIVDTTRPYKVYTALLTQSGTNAPIATVLENTLGNIVWSYSSVGSYQATLTGAFTSKTFFYIFSEAFYNSGPQIYGQKIRNLTRITNDIVSLDQIGLNFTAGVYSSAGGENNFTNVSIEIRVYN